MWRWKHPKTIQDARANQPGVHDDEVPPGVKLRGVRARRNKANLPDSWDEEQKRVPGKSWKERRKTQRRAD